ncbi:MAG: F-type H+-transporting ATPase subunit b [Planctomycetota bacterium]|jgi:F-type H+-transporting ATPase subunit b
MYIFLSGHTSFNPLHVEPGYLVWSAVTFAILLAILYKVGWGPLTKAIEDREAGIRNDIDAAKKARADADADMALYKKQLEEASEKAKQLLEDARAAAERAKQTILEDAQEQADSLRSQAKREIEAATEKAMAEIKTYIVDVAMSASTKFVAGSVDKAAHAKLVDSALSKAGELN